MNCWKSEHTPEGHATRLFQINYQSEVGQHILCSNMYEWQADYLVQILKSAPIPNLTAVGRPPDVKEKG